VHDCNFGGDFQQILPVVYQGSQEDVVSASLLRLLLWVDIQVLKLVEQTRGQCQTGRNDLPGKGESVAKWMVIVENKKC